ncbi:MAG: FtsX-like permease family protein [Acidobacteria bacterium]|nr:FtsX-like permease family protein [Acidobacteriota bacterium]
MLDAMRRKLGWGRGALEADIREEMLAHIALCVDDNVAAGMDPDSARQDAERRFGDIDRLVGEGQTAKRSRHDPLGHFPNRSDRSPGANLMNDLIADIRFGIRMLWKSPMFTFVAVLSLAVGIGFNVTMFSVVDAVLFSPFPAADPDRVVRVRQAGDAFGDLLMSYPDFVDLRDTTETFAQMASVRTEMGTYNDDGDVSFVFGESVSANYFGLLGRPPLIGRTFTPEEEIAGNHRVIMVSPAFWRERLGASEDVLGTQLAFGGESYTLVGVVSEEYTGLVPPLKPSFWVPTPGTEDFSGSLGATSMLERRQSRGFYVLGQLADSASVEQSDAEVQAIGAQLAAEYPDTNEEIGFRAMPAADVRIDPAADQALLPAAGVLMGTVGLILLLACANVANMMLARGSVRRQEIGLRMALGAGRGRLVRQLLTESLMLSAIGGILAVVIAEVAIRLLLSLQPPVIVPIDLAIDVNARVWVYAGAVALLTGLVFGLVPAFRSTRADLSQSLRGDEASSDGSQRGSRLRNSLVVAQVTLSLVLLISAALMLRSLQNAQSIDPGIATESVVNISAGLLFQGHQPDAARDFHLRALDRFEAIPGVEQVAYAERLPLESTITATRSVYAEGVELSEDEDPPSVMTTTVTPEYFEVMEISIDQGRLFDGRDVEDAGLVAIMNQVLADQLWPGQNPLGKHVVLGVADGPEVEVIGIHSPHKVRTLGEEPTPNLYLPYAQDTGSGLGNMIARTRGDAGAVLTQMRQILREMDPALAVLEVETIRQHLALSLFPVRLSAGALGLLGIIGALLAAVGVYGVVAFAVARRTREIGIRMAIGADRRSVLSMVLRQGMGLIGIGAVIGVAVSLAFTRVLGAMLYGVSATDAFAFVGAVLALGLIGVIANVVPALRAAHVEPTSALRTE